jgi:hypothetical protein
MKKVLLSLVAVSIVIGAQGQTTVSTTTSGTIVSGAAVTPASLSFTFPGITNLFAPVLTNLTANGVAVGDISPLLLELETNLVRLLPAIAAFNISVDAAANMAVPATQVGVNPGNNQSALTSGNLSSLSSTNLGSSYGTALGADLSGIVGGRAPAIVPAQPALTTTTGPNGAATTTTIMTANNGVGVVENAAAMSTTNGFAFTNAQDALRALVVLQADIENMLPIVEALNGTTNANAAPLTVPSTTTAISPALTPTGR